MSRTLNDALRSFRKYVADSLDVLASPPQGYVWEVRLADEKGAFKRPFVAIEATTPESLHAQSSVVQVMSQSFQAMCHPLIPDDAVTAKLNAGAIAEALYQAVGVGTRPLQYGPVRHPFRIPIYDYAGLSIDQPVDVSAWDKSWMRIEGDPGVNVMRDETDELYYTITLNIRMSWTRSAAVPSGAVILQSLKQRGGN